MRVSLLIIGGGLSGLAAAIRAARFFPDVLLLEKHSRIGGLNSYFFRNNTLFETGLHAITNYAAPDNKHAPLNKLLRQLKIKRSLIPIAEQRESAIVFQDLESLSFSNNIELLQSEVEKKFPESYDAFLNLLAFIAQYDPFQNRPFISARKMLNEKLNGNKLLSEMLICPLLYYGSATVDDIDLDQFVIMFRAIFLEGMFRPRESIKQLLELLETHYLSLGGNIQKNSRVTQVNTVGDRAVSLDLADGQHIEFDHLISTAGLTETFDLLKKTQTVAPATVTNRLGFVESIFSADSDSAIDSYSDNTIVFFNKGARFKYRSPQTPVDFDSGVICFPGNFHGLETGNRLQLRSTHLASYEKWKDIGADKSEYLKQKQAMSARSLAQISDILGADFKNVRCEDSFTPLTIERYTAKKMGAIYGSPVKIKDGRIGLANLFLAGTDQGFLGIVGSMLSGVSIVNQHILPKI